MAQKITTLTLLLCVAFAGCAPLNKYSYESFGRPKQTFDNYDPTAGPARSDLLAIQYADYVARLLEGRSTGAQLTREISDSTLVVGGALAGAQETLNIAAETVAQIGVGLVIIRELQGIFNARGRSEAFADAAYLVRQAQAEYRAFNPNPSPAYMTENGATLVRRVDSAVHAARKTLTGRMPALLDLQQATQPMSEAGAKKREPGPTNYLAPATGNVPLPPLQQPVQPGPGVVKPNPPTPNEVLIRQAAIQESIDTLPQTALPADAVTEMDRLDPPTTAADGTQLIKYSRDKTGLRRLVGKTRKLEDLNAIQKSLGVTP